MSQNPIFNKKNIKKNEKLQKKLLTRVVMNEAQSRPEKEYENNRFWCGFRQKCCSNFVGFQKPSFHRILHQTKMTFDLFCQDGMEWSFGSTTIAALQVAVFHLCCFVGLYLWPLISLVFHNKINILFLKIFLFISIEPREQAGNGSEATGLTGLSFHTCQQGSVFVRVRVRVYFLSHLLVLLLINWIFLLFN